MATVTVWKASNQMEHQLKYNLFYQRHQTLERRLKIIRHPLIEQQIILENSPKKARALIG